MVDYSITWEYIVKEMAERYGIKPDSKEKFSLRELMCYVDCIWQDWCDGIHFKEINNIKKTLDK